MLQLPETPTPNERVLAGWTVDVFTGLTTATLTLSGQPARGANVGGWPWLLFKNGALLLNSAGASNYTVSGQTVTLGTALVNTDVVQVYYCARV